MLIINYIDMRFHISIIIIMASPNKCVLLLSNCFCMFEHLHHAQSICSYVDNGTECYTVLYSTCPSLGHSKCHFKRHHVRN